MFKPATLAQMQQMQRAQGAMGPAACAVPDAEDVRKGDIARYLGELLKLSPGDLRAVGIGLTAELGSSALSGSDEYKVPGDSDLVIYQVQGGFASNALASEVALNAGVFTHFSPSELAAVRLANCLVTMTNKDRQLPFFDNGGVRLSTITPPVGAPQFLPPMAPYLVPSGITLRAEFALQDSTAAVAGQLGDYTLYLGGFLIPKRV